jgi:hypothetical protein
MLGEVEGRKQRAEIVPSEFERGLRLTIVLHDSHHE